MGLGSAFERVQRVLGELEPEDRQEHVIDLLHQVGDVKFMTRDGAGAAYLHLLGDCGAGFSIVVIVGTDGSVAWSLR